MSKANRWKSGDSSGTDETIEEQGIISQAIRLFDEKVIDFSFLAALAGDREMSTVERERFRRTERERGATLYSDLLFSLCYQRYDHKTSKGLWLGIMKHKEELSVKLGRNVGLMVAALDYLTNVRQLLSSTSFMAESNLKHLLRMAVSDSLTDMFDRVTLECLLKQMLQQHRRLKKAISIVLIDVDDFKLINDDRGHLFGDDVLAHLSGLIRNSLRDTDIAIRYGGEEFATILPGMKLERAIDVASMLCGRVASKTIHGHRLTISAGVATAPDHGWSWKGLLNVADRALYRAKQNGKNGVGIPEKSKYTRHYSSFKKEDVLNSQKHNHHIYDEQTMGGSRT
jgi:diguanylate cyclase (GGDEF)-like protein